MTSSHKLKIEKEESYDISSDIKGGWTKYHCTLNYYIRLVDNTTNTKKQEVYVEIFITPDNKYLMGVYVGNWARYTFKILQSRTLMNARKEALTTLNKRGVNHYTRGKHAFKDESVVFFRNLFYPGYEHDIADMGLEKLKAKTEKT
jgi:hypothetical protein